MTIARTLFFVAPGEVQLREEELPALAAGEVLVETLCSAISPGTEMLVYRGQFPKNIPVDDCFPGMNDQFHYPLAYGYACVGRVTEIGSQVDAAWLGRLVFAFHPHASHFIVPASMLLTLPAGVSPEMATFLPNTETAVNLVQDGAPLLGERVLVLGQGVIGLLVTAILGEFPLETLVTTDFLPLRRAASQKLGVTACLDASAPGLGSALQSTLKGGADLTFELSGSPLALDTAIQHTIFSGRVVIGSWYGEKRAALDLGGFFHRSRLRLISSQVSTIAPELAARWDKPRRFDVAWLALKRIHPEKWITHRFSFDKAAEAYRLLDQAPGEAIQVIFDY